ncbi:Protein EMBRYONIC FLOWER 1 [Striga hermonthica]|uniref:Protein EMBRYONIC FLOWER 1 n=1 Tax=Striga hermonthica TaxID=68872 RepID=A0A9N7N384_STRHE|nr:Protein EMBRYONIC FLOWER 1 [Striga hermonthica]
MDSIVVVEECNKRSESLALASKTSASASLVQINSIAIDINCAAEEIDQSPKHEHFSIRGFVSEMRKRDWKKCNPFASESENNNGGLDLPPLSVPKFRWWQCPNCVPEFADHESNLGMILADKSVTAEGNCCENVNSGEKQGLLTHSIQKIGNEETNYTGDKIIAYNSWCADGYNKAAAHFRTTEVGPSWTHVPETNQIQLIEAPEKSSDASDKVCSAGKATSGSDDTIAYSALPHKRKPKLRSLADIINEERNFAFEHPRTKSLSSSQTEDDSNLQSRLDVSSDTAAKSTKTPLRKRKNIVHEDDGPPEKNSPTFVAKKSKGSILEPENNSKAFKRVEIPESDSENVRTAGKALHSKARKQKALDINRKTRRTLVENRTAVQMMSNSSVHCANLGNNFGNMGDLGAIFKKSVSGQERMDVFSDLSKKDKRPEGDCTVREKVALDLSLSSYMGAEINSKNQESSGKCTGIPDLNESFVDKTNVMEGQQVPDFIETRSFAVHEYLDISAPSNNEPAREGEGPSEVLLEHRQAAQNMYYNNNNTVIERGPSSDDIPMEIVELLAKNQHDKAHDNSRKHLGPEGIINSSFKRAHYVENNRGPFNFSYGSPRTGPNVANGNMGLGQEFLNPDKTQLRHLSPLTAAHSRIPLYPGPNPLSRPKPREGVDLLWPPRRKSVTFDLAGLEDHSYRGKSIGYLSCDQGKKAATDESLVKEGKIGLGCRPVGPIDTYSNETIPAMQLLSLMDQGAISGSKVGPNNFLDRQFSPCNHHPRLNKNDNPNEKFVGSSSFFMKSNNHIINDFPTLLNGARFSGESSKKSFSQVQILPQQNGYSKSVDHLGGPSNLAGQASRSDDLKLEICTLNRNPADFSIPDSRNVFMISAKDLKPKRRISSKDRGRPPVNFDGPKRPKMRNNSSVKKARENNSRAG